MTIFSNSVCFSECPNFKVAKRNISNSPLYLPIRIYQAMNYTFREWKSIFICTMILISVIWSPKGVEFMINKFVLLRFWYLCRARSGIWKTSRHLKNTRVTHNERKYQTSVNLTGMSSVDVEFQDVPFKVTKCDQILAYIVIGSIFVGFIFCILYGYYLTFLDAKDGKIRKNDLRRFRPIKFNT